MENVRNAAASRMPVVGPQFNLVKVERHGENDPVLAGLMASWVSSMVEGKPHFASPSLSQPGQCSAAP